MARVGRWQGPGEGQGTRTAYRDARLVSVDLARLLALLGMFAAHLVIPLPGQGPGGVDGLFQLVAGRSSALFALLAGVSLAIVSREAGDGPGAHRRRLLVRAAAVAGLGLVLGLPSSGVAVILVYYALLFCCALPVLTWRARPLIWLALGWGLLSPVTSLLIRPLLPPTTYQVPSVVSLADPWQLLTELVVTGYYPVLTWATYLFAGLAVGRLLAPPGAAPSDARVPARVGNGLVLVGAWLAVLALAVSRLVTRSEQARAALVETAGAGGWPEVATDLRRGFYGVHPEGTPWWLGVWAPHSGSVVDLAHTIGCALLVLGVCWWAVRLLPVLPWRLLAGAGAMTLTLYTLHVAILSSPLGEAGRPLARGGESALVLHTALALALGSTFAVLRRPGPLEQVVRRLTSEVGR